MAERNRQMHGRREFLRGASATTTAIALGGGSAILPSVALGADDDWKRAFSSVGFDPAAPGCATFIVVGDPHVPCGDDSSAHLRNTIDFWNDMRPRPGFVFSMGDQVSTVSMQMGDRLTITNPDKRARASRDIMLFRSYFDRLEIPFHHTIGNHDSYPGEVDAAFYGGHFPGWKPYGRFEFAGATFMNWNGGHDGHIDPVQRKWILAEAKTIPDDRPLFVVTHYPNLGVGRVDGYGIALMLLEAFGNRRGETWLLAGHNHEDAFSTYALPGGGRLSVMTHVRETGGWWIYGLRNGHVAARVRVSHDGTARAKTSAAADGGRLRVPFEDLPGRVWSHFVGCEGDAKYRVEVVQDDLFDGGHWFIYLNEVTYRLPLRSVGGADRFALFARMWGHFKTKEREKLFVSDDNKNWTRMSAEWGVGVMHVFDVPESLRGAEWLYVKVVGFGFNCGSSLGGFALARSRA